MQKYGKEPVVPDLQNKWQTGWWWPPKIVEVNHSNRLSRTRSCLNAKAWAHPCSPGNLVMGCLQSGLPQGTQRTQEDYWIPIQHPDRVLNHSRLQQTLEQKNRVCQLNVYNFSAKVIVCQGLNALLFARLNSNWVCRSPLYICHLLRFSISAFSETMLKLRISQMVVQLPSSCWPLTGKQIKSTFCCATSGRAKLEQNCAGQRPACRMWPHPGALGCRISCHIFVVQLPTKQKREISLSTNVP